MFLKVPCMSLVLPPLLVVVLHVEHDVPVLPVSLQPAQQSQHSDGAELTVKLPRRPGLGSEAALAEHLPAGWGSGGSRYLMFYLALHSIKVLLTADPSTHRESTPLTVPPPPPSCHLPALANIIN